MSAINLSTRIRFVNDDGTLTPEAFRSLSEILSRSGGALGNAGGDTFVSNDAANVQSQPSAGGDIAADVQGVADMQAIGETTGQPASGDSVTEMVMQPVADRAMTAPEPITPSASPFTYRASRDGYFIVTSGTVSKQEYGRGAVFTDVGLLTSMLPILLGDAIRVTYSAAPILTFIPR